jgi:NADH dehydrogenase
MLRPHVVILGAGFGGTYVAKSLIDRVKKGEIDLTIVNRTNYFLFTPLLHEVATGSLSPRNVAEPLREIFVHTGVRIVQGSVDSINAGERTVTIRDNGSTHSIPYDYLVIALGAETNYYGIPGAAELTLPLKSLADAAAVRNRIIDSFERAILASDQAERKAILSFAVVGGGPTGVELAAELSEFVQGMVKRYYDGSNCRADDPRKCGPEEPTITLVNAGKELLEMFKPELRTAALDRLQKNGVIVRSSTAVTNVTRSGMTTAAGDPIPASTIIWTAGVKAIVPHFSDIKPTLMGGRLSVDSYFRLLGNDRIFVLGDAAAYVDVHDFQKDSANTRPLPMLAQVAEAQSGIVARNVMASIDQKQLRDFHYHSQGSMVSVGQWFAIGEIFSMKLAGRFTWWLWRTVYLFKFASWRKRVRIALEWAYELISPRDITKL